MLHFCVPDFSIETVKFTDWTASTVLELLQGNNVQVVYVDTLAKVYYKDKKYADKYPKYLLLPDEGRIIPQGAVVFKTESGDIYIDKDEFDDDYINAEDDYDVIKNVTGTESCSYCCDNGYTHGAPCHCCELGINHHYKSATGLDHWRCYDASNIIREASALCYPKHVTQVAKQEHQVVTLITKSEKICIKMKAILIPQSVVYVHNK